MSYPIYIILVLIICIGVCPLQSQSLPAQEDMLPSVFLIGEYEEPYEKMIGDCNNHLLNVCEGSMDIAYNVWLHMVNQMEEFAVEKSFDINGTKIWLTAYWNFDGSIKHLVYYPKPHSKNMDFTKLTEFLDEFSKIYKLPLKSSGCFSHYGSANFPSFANYYIKDSKK